MKLFLAPFRIESETGTQNRLRTRKTESVLACLALRRGQWVTRRELLDLFWSEAPEADARPKLRLALHSIRGAIGDLLETQGDQVRIGGLWVDALDAEPSGMTGSRLLPDRIEEWLIPYQLALDARLRSESVQQLREAENSDDQVEALLALIRVEPLNPAYHAALYQTLSDQGHRVAAASAARRALEQLGPDAPEELAAAAGRASRTAAASSAVQTELAYRLLGPHEPVVASLVGPAGIGKTHAARSLMALARAEEIETLFLDFERLDKGIAVRQHFFTALAHEFGGAPDQVRPEDLPPTLVVLDGVESWPAEQFGFLVDGELSGSSLRVLLTTQTEPDPAFNPVRQPRQTLPEGPTLPELEAGEAVQMICRLLDRTVDEFEPEMLYRAAVASGGLPLALKFVAQELALGMFQSQRADLPLEARLLRAYQRLTAQQRSQLHLLSTLQPAFHVELAGLAGVDVDSLQALAALFWIEPGGSLETCEILPPILRFLASVSPPDLSLLDRSYDALVEAGLEMIETDYFRITKVFLPSAATLEAMIRRDLAEGREDRAALAYPILYMAWHHQPEIERAIDLGAACLGAEHNEKWDRHPAALNAWASACFFGKRAALAEPLYTHLVKSEVPRYRYVGHANLGLIELNNGNAARAVELMQVSLQDPDASLRQHASRLNNLAKAQFLNGEPALAVESGLKAAELCADDERLQLLKGVIYFSLAEMHLLLGQSEEALRWGRRAEAIFQQTNARLRHVQACMLMACAAVYGGDPEAAKAALSKAGRFGQMGSSHWAPAAACVLAAMGLSAEAGELAGGFALDSQENWVQQILGRLEPVSERVRLSNQELLALFEQLVKRL